jgi:hypothetical protein
MTVSRTDTLCWSSAAYWGRVARPSAGPLLPADQELADMQEWPLRSYLELRALPESVGSARRHARATLRDWRLDGLTDTVELLVSEVITNAVHASADRADRPSPPRASWLRCWLTSDRDRVLIQVWDGDRGTPARRRADPDAEAGRGLLLVESLSTRWGWYAPAGLRGKVVWAVCAR